MASYTYPISAFPNDAVSLGELETEIENTSITGTISGSTSHEGYTHIAFFAAITGAEKTTLDGVVAVHDGILTDAVSDSIVVERVETFTSTASAYTEVLSLSASIPPGSQGDYKLSWFVLYGIDSGLVNFRMRLLQDDTETLMGYTEEVPNSDPDERIPRSGFIPLKNLKKGYHHFDLECGKETGGDVSWKVFKAFLELRRLK